MKSTNEKRKFSFLFELLSEWMVEWVDCCLHWKVKLFIFRHKRLYVFRPSQQQSIHSTQQFLFSLIKNTNEWINKEINGIEGEKWRYEPAVKPITNYRVIKESKLYFLYEASGSSINFTSPFNSINSKEKHFFFHWFIEFAKFVNWMD